MTDPGQPPARAAKKQKFFGSFLQKRTACLAFACSCVVLPAFTQVLTLHASPPARDFGYLVGDVLTRRVDLTLAPGTVLDRRSLPPVGPIAGAIDLRDVMVRGDSIDFTYQTFLAPEQVARVEVPGFTLRFVSGAQNFTARVPGFGFAVSPFRHDLQPVIDPQALRPDHADAASDTVYLTRILYVSAIFGLASLCVLAGIQFFYLLPGRTSKPFGIAAHRLTRDALSCDAGFIAVHRAFDATAGEPVLREDVGQFLERHTAFASLQEDIRTFFSVSNDIFFNDKSGVSFEIAGFARRLARAERRG